MNQIDAWARELRTLRDAGAIKRFRQRFDKATAQRIIRSPELSEADRAAISLTIQFSGASCWGYGEACWFDGEEIGLASIPSPQDSKQSNGG